MACCAVEISVDCHCACLAHALTTEKEEVMGLLVGDTIVSVAVPYAYLTPNL